MLGHASDVFAPGEAGGQKTTTGEQHIPRSYRFSPPRPVNLVLGAAALLGGWWLVRQGTKGKGR